MSRSLMGCAAPAKLNLFLHITGRRPDGYHLLQSVFQLLDHGDTLDFVTRDDGQVRRVTEVPGVPEESDLIVRAARLLQQAMTERGRSVAVPGAEISIVKRLPMGGGLGGGSSDAATTLLALNHLWDAGLSRDELMAVGLKLGADIPFFLFGENAFVEGVGEAMTAVELPESWFIVIEPGVAIPTAKIFCETDLTRDSKPVKISDFSRAPMEFGKNDLQAVAQRLYAPVANAIAWLSKFGQARMTGSGACVFCPLQDEALADKVLALVPQEWKAWKAKGIPKHPMAYLADR